MTRPMKPRRPDWPERLDQSLRAAACRPFRYGRHDCCLSVCNAVRAMTGEDLAAGIRGYKNKQEALAALQDAGGLPRLARRITRQRKIAEIAPAFAQRGDIAIVIPGKDLDLEAPALAIVDMTGQQILVASKVGWRALPRRRAARAWRIE